MADFDALLTRTDPDRRLAALFAEPDVRARLFTLYAFYHEIARVPDTVSESVIGEMRLAWAREAVEDLYANPAKVRRHDVYEALAALKDLPGAPAKEALVGLVEARAADLGQGPFPNAEDRRDYIDRTAGALIQCAARLAEPNLDLSEAAEDALRAAGRAWGYAGLIRAFPDLCHAGRPPLTKAEVEDYTLTETDLARGLKPDLASVATRQLYVEAYHALAAWRDARAALPASVFPAVGYLALTKGYLKPAARLSDPYRERVERPLALRQLHLTWASLTGRI